MSYKKVPPTSKTIRIMKFLIFLLFANSFADPIPSNEKILEVGTILSNNLKSGKCAEDFFRLGKCFAPHEVSNRNSADLFCILISAYCRPIPRDRERKNSFQSSNHEKSG